MSRREYWGGGRTRFSFPVLDLDSGCCVNRPAASFGPPARDSQPVCVPGREPCHSRGGQDGRRRRALSCRNQGQRFPLGVTDCRGVVMASVRVLVTVGHAGKCHLCAREHTAMSRVCKSTWGTWMRSQWRAAIRVRRDGLLMVSDSVGRLPEALAAPCLPATAAPEGGCAPESAAAEVLPPAGCGYCPAVMSCGCRNGARSGPAPGP